MYSLKEGHLFTCPTPHPCLGYSFGTWPNCPGGYCRIFWIGVCREGSWTLTLFKDKGSENWYPFKGPNPKNDTLFKGPKQRLTRPSKHERTNLCKDRCPCTSADTSGLISHFFFVSLGAYALRILLIQFRRPIYGLRQEHIAKRRKKWYPI